MGVFVVVKKHTKRTRQMQQHEFFIFVSGHTVQESSIFIPNLHENV